MSFCHIVDQLKGMPDTVKFAPFAVVMVNGNEGIVSIVW